MEKSYPFTLLPRYPGAREYPYSVTLLPQSYPITPMLPFYIVLPYYPHVILIHSVTLLP